jgi:hypothetical protein
VDKNKQQGAILLAVYFFIAIYLVPIFPHGGSANELTRWATAVSIVEKNRLNIRGPSLWLVQLSIQRK